MTAAPTFAVLPLSAVSASPHNPRRSMDEAALSELAASVKEKGVLEPLLVRPFAGGERYEVAAGARRLAAAKLAGLKEVPCLVRDMSDAELLEVAILENVMRADISALEEGDAYRTLTKVHGYTIEQLVEKTGRSRTVVFQRMKLASLTGEPRAMLEKGLLSASVAELVARLPTEAAQEQAVKLLDAKKHYKFELSTLPFRDAKLILDEELRLVLKEAPFDTKDGALFESAGACTACPKRTGADKISFPDVKADTCLDGACWAKKKALAFKALQAQLKADGKRVEKAKGLFNQWAPEQLSQKAAVKYAQPDEEAAAGKSWKALLGKEMPTLVVLDEENRPHVLVDKAAAVELLAAKDPKAAKALAEPTTTADDWKERQRKQDEERRRFSLVHTSVRTSALAGVKKLDAAVDMLILSWGNDSYAWEGNLARAGLPRKLRPEKLTLEQKVKLLVADAFTNRRQEFVSAAAQVLKVDLKKVRKQAADFPPGTCFCCAKELKDKAESLCDDCVGLDE